MCVLFLFFFFFFSSRRRHTRLQGDWSSDVCSSDLLPVPHGLLHRHPTVAVAVGPALEHALVDDESGPDRLVPGLVLVGLLVGRRRSQIGRASCRERGEVVGGGGALREKSYIDKETS